MIGTEIKKWFIKSPVRFYIIALLISVILIIPLNVLLNTNPGDILVEFHGLVFDLIVFGIILTLYESFKNQIEEQNKADKERNEKIQKFYDDIDDYRYWHEPESAHKIVGTIRRLNKLGVANFDLKNCFLRKGLLQDLDLSNSFLGGADLQDTPCRLTNFSGSYLAHADFTNSFLGGANLEGCLLGYVNFTYDNKKYEIQLENTVMYGVKLNNAKVARKDWFKTLKNKKIEGLEELIEKYEIDDELKEEQIILKCGNVTYDFKAKYYLIKEMTPTAD